MSIRVQGSLWATVTKMEKLRRKIRMFAFHTRLFILILQFVCNWVIPDHEVIGVEDAVIH